MFRYKLTIEYDGSRFCGWQRQEPGVPSVQEAIETALYTLFKEKTLVEGAGRTDSGVHALGQVAHCDLSHDHPLYRMQDGLNYFLVPQGASILKIEPVSLEFHARFSATSRSYIYKIFNRRAPSPLERQRMWHVVRPLDVESMQHAATLLLGTHDFSAFRAGQCQAASPIRTLDHLTLTQDGDQITAFIQARSFLHNQVRIMMGTLQQIGLSKWPPSKMQEILEGRDRRYAGPTAPSHGLYLAQVGYENTL
jgi:tRNA pseudouridine38-40 synthase